MSTQKHRRTSLVRRLTGWTLNFMILAIVLMCLAWIAPSVLGYSRYVITGASMTGTIDKGSVVFEKPVDVADLAMHGSAVDAVGQCQRCGLATAPGLAVALAQLAAFRRVDPPQPDAGAVQVERVAVDDADHTGLAISGERRRADGKAQGTGEHLHRVRHGRFLKLR